MVPPTEQLIRDYLNRLSMAARGQLEPDDGRALVDRAREFIARQAGSAGPPSAMEVGKLLSRLGDPSALVQQERQRLIAIGGELPEPPEPRNPIARVLRRDSGKPRSASWHWPVADGRTDLQLRLLDSASTDDAGSNGSNAMASAGTAGEDGRSASEKSRPFVPAQRRDRDWFFRALGGDADSTTAGVVDGASDSSGGPAPATGNHAWRLTNLRKPMRSPPVGRALSAAATWYRRRPLEASAVVLLGLGGAIYPPVWLLGAAVALPSRVWDGRDKWLGLALPLLLTIGATALGITAGAHVSLRHAIHDGWVFAVAGSRVAAVLGASYLCWRSVHGRRPPAVPPWNRPHRVS